MATQEGLDLLDDSYSSGLYSRLGSALLFLERVGGQAKLVDGKTSNTLRAQMDKLATVQHGSTIILGGEISIGCTNLANLSGLKFRRKMLRCAPEGL